MAPATTPQNIPLPSAQAASTQAQSTANRLSRWIEDNRNLAIALGLGSVVAGGAAGYYYFSSSTSSRKATSKDKKSVSFPDEKSSQDSGDQAGSNGTGAAAKSKKKKKKSSSSSSKSSSSSSGSDPLASSDGPLLTEASDESLISLPASEIEKLPKERRVALAQILKAAGNKEYSSKHLEEAINLYTKAIAADPLAVFYSNRAACYANLGRPRDVIPDCNIALEKDKSYVKALNRRAVAQEQIGGDAEVETSGEELEEKKTMLYNSLSDFTAVAILGHFADNTATEAVERVLKKLATVKAKDILRTRDPKLPSPTFVTAYLEAFRKKPHPTLPAEPSQGDQTLLLAYQALDARNYPHACSLFNQAVEQGPSTGELKTLAHNMSGTFKFIIGKAPEALDDLNRATEYDPNHVQSWVKKASVHMELGDKEAAFADFDRAIAADPNDPDVFYHRGQVHFILGEFTEAMADYEKSTSLDDTFIFSQVQHAVAQYKLNNTAESTASFQRILDKFSNSSEASNYYGELLLDQQRFEDALRHFNKAIEIEQSKDSSRNVLPMINKALALFQWKQDMPAAERLCREALKIDEDCDVAVATLAQLCLNQGKLQESIEAFKRSAEIARTEPELMNALTYENATQAQLDFIRNYPDQGAALAAIAQGA